MKNLPAYLFAIFLILVWIGLMVYFDQTGNKALAKEVLEGGGFVLGFIIVFGGLALLASDDS